MASTYEPSIHLSRYCTLLRWVGESDGRSEHVEGCNLCWQVGTIVAIVVYKLAGKIWPMEKVGEGEFMDGDVSSFGHTDKEMKVPVDEISNPL